MMTRSSEFGLSEIGQIALTVSDLEAAVSYYRDVLGMQLLFQVPGMAFFQCGSVRLLVGLPEGEGELGSTVLYYRVDDIHSAYKTLRERDVDFVHDPRLVHKTDAMELWLAFFRDADKNLLALMSEVKLGTDLDRRGLGDREGW